ncbi:sperm-associated antigen 5 [Polyodon spathula]|uniref:sperm-associated antigen 5 n=1 Tax=Polyodon spathula TaxID=7913 RepID=UPI001B7F2C80|nr:sperm-associated antigen 5 [Polyodon spathula]
MSTRRKSSAHTPVGELVRKSIGRTPLKDLQNGMKFAAQSAAILPPAFSNLNIKEEGLGCCFNSEENPNCPVADNEARNVLGFKSPFLLWRKPERENKIVMASDCQKENEEPLSTGDNALSSLTAGRPGVPVTPHRGNKPSLEKQPADLSSDNTESPGSLRDLEEARVEACDAGEESLQAQICAQELTDTLEEVDKDTTCCQAPITLKEDTLKDASLLEESIINSIEALFQTPETMNTVNTEIGVTDPQHSNSSVCEPPLNYEEKAGIISTMPVADPSGQQNTETRSSLVVLTDSETLTSSQERCDAKTNSSSFLAVPVPEICVGLYASTVEDQEEHPVCRPSRQIDADFSPQGNQVIEPYSSLIVDGEEGAPLDSSVSADDPCRLEEKEQDFALSFSEGECPGGAADCFVSSPCSADAVEAGLGTPVLSASPTPAENEHRSLACSPESLAAPLADEQSRVSLTEEGTSNTHHPAGLEDEDQQDDEIATEALASELNTTLQLSVKTEESRESQSLSQGTSSGFCSSPSSEAEGGNVQKSLVSDLFSSPSERAPVLSKSLQLAGCPLLLSAKRGVQKQSNTEDISLVDVKEVGSNTVGSEPVTELLPAPNVASTPSSPVTGSDSESLRRGKRKLESPGACSLAKLQQSCRSKGIDSPVPQLQMNSTVDASPKTQMDWDISLLTAASSEELCTEGETPEKFSTAEELGALQKKVEVSRASPVLKTDGRRFGASKTAARALKQLLLMMETEMTVNTSHEVGTCVTPVEHAAATTWITPVTLHERGANTSGVFERKREVSVNESSTNTDSLLWNLPRDTLNSAPRQELEKRLESALVVVEVLSQQLIASRESQSKAASVGPSEQRDRLVQTDHTEFSQVEQQYRKLYTKAVDRIQSLEVEHEERLHLHRRMSEVRREMNCNFTDVNDTLSVINEICTIASEDKKAMTKQMAQMKELHSRNMKMLKKMKEATQESVQERDEMQHRMEGALKAKQAAYCVTEELRSRSTARIRELELDGDCYQDLCRSLKPAYEEQISLKREYVESVQTAEELYVAVKEDQSKLKLQLREARGILQQSARVLSALHERARDAARQWEAMRLEVEDAVLQKEQIQGELTQANSDLEDARNTIGDLNVHNAIFNSEVKLLRERLSNVEQEHDQLQHRNEKLSIQLSSAEASQALLQQAFAAETEKVQLSWEKNQELTEILHHMERVLGDSQLENSDLRARLQECETQLTLLQELQQEQTQKLQHMQELQKQVSSMKDLNEFIQQENQLSREQIAETELLLKSHLHALRERNLECEDLKETLSLLRIEKENLQEELDTTKDKARSMMLDMGKEINTSSSEITLLQEKLKRLMGYLQTALEGQKPGSPVKHGAPKLCAQTPCRAAGASFVGSVLVAIAGDEANDPSHTDTDSEEQKPDGLGSGNSAFTRVVPTTPKRIQEAEQGGLLERLEGLGETVTELFSTISQLREAKESEEKELRQNIADLQSQLHALTLKQASEVSDLKEEIEGLQTKIELQNQALKRQAEKEKELEKLCEEYEASRQLFHRQRLETVSLQREMAELQHSLQMAETEALTLREELSKRRTETGQGDSWVEEKILLRKEVRKLTERLLEAEDGKSKLLARAMRHRAVFEENLRKSDQELKGLDEMIEAVRRTLSSIPDVVANCEELKNLKTYLG